MSAFVPTLDDLMKLLHEQREKGSLGAALDSLSESLTRYVNAEQTPDTADRGRWEVCIMRFCVAVERYTRQGLHGAPPDVKLAFRELTKTWARQLVGDHAPQPIQGGFEELMGHVNWIIGA